MCAAPGGPLPGRRRAARRCRAASRPAAGADPGDLRQPGMDATVRKARVEPLGVDGLHLPPLAERRSDLPPRDPPRAAPERVAVAPAEQEGPPARSERSREARGVPGALGILERVEEPDVED